MSWGESAEEKLLVSMPSMSRFTALVSWLSERNQSSLKGLGRKRMEHGASMSVARSAGMTFSTTARTYAVVLVAGSEKPRGEATELPKKTERPIFSGRTQPFVAVCTEVRDREPSTDVQVAESASETKSLLRY